MSLEINLLEILFMVLTILCSGLTFILILKKGWLEQLSKYPLDFGLHLNGKRLLGDHKTIRGPVSFIISTIFFGYMFIYILEPDLGRIDLPLIVAFMILGCSYSIGEIPNSLIKRQLNIKPGEMYVGKLSFIQSFFDNFDSLFACGLVFYLIFKFEPINILIAILIGGCLHLLTDIYMRHLHLKK